MVEVIKKELLDEFIIEYKKLSEKGTSIDGFDYELRVFYHVPPKGEGKVPQKVLVLSPDEVFVNVDDTFGYLYEY